MSVNFKARNGEKKDPSRDSNAGIGMFLSLERVPRVGRWVVFSLVNLY